MRFKVDENLPPEASTFLVEQGHDALSIWDQNLQGANDRHLADVCRAEQRVLVTFDLGFADIRQYDPREWPGFVVLRLGSQARRHVMGVLRRVAPFFSTLTLGGRLWVVTESEIRVRGGEEEDATEL
jgi:predicted nuclease of predicted toxin-antitoxin system